MSRERSGPLLKKRDDLDEISESTLVICPNCQNEFQFAGYKFFGFLDNKSFKLLVILFILGFIFFAVAVLVRGLT